MNGWSGMTSVGLCGPDLFAELEGTNAGTVKNLLSCCPFTAKPEPPAVLLFQLSRTLKEPDLLGSRSRNAAGDALCWCNASEWSLI